MEITIKADPKEIAALVVAIQERREVGTLMMNKSGVVFSNDGVTTCYGVPSHSKDGG